MLELASPHRSFPTQSSRTQPAPLGCELEHGCFSSQGSVLALPPQWTCVKLQRVSAFTAESWQTIFCINGPSAQAHHRRGEVKRPEDRA
jgi:hypothetical protein